ncbi:MAG: TetR/AcrR family transcriptional regulator [Atopobiaceae bacterium]|jgi:AcrR family transcriptional regulator|nr:TetR/AcrR family transcriptional regulator [Atopobiaceae bacterium]
MEEQTMGLLDRKTDGSGLGGDVQPGELMTSGGLGAMMPKIIDPERTAELVSEAKEARAAHKAKLERRVARVQRKEEKFRARTESKTRKSAATRERIMDAASELISENNGIEFQMSDVAARCDMSKGALYYYFADRQDLVEAIFNNGIDEFVSRLERSVTDARSSREALRGLCSEFSECVRTGGPVVFAMASELISGKRDSVFPTIESRLQRVSHIIATQLERAKGEGVVRPEVDSDIAASYACGSFFFAAIEAWGKAEGGQIDTDSFTEKLVDLMMYGVGTAKAGE